MAETKKKTKKKTKKNKGNGNPVFEQLTAIEAELERLRPIYEKDVVNNPITDKKRLNRLALQNLKVNRKGLGIGKHWLDTFFDPSDGLDSVISKLEKRQNLLQRTLATREYGPGAKLPADIQGVIREFGGGGYTPRREGLKTLMVGDNPYYDQRYDAEVIAHKKNKLGTSPSNEDKPLTINKQDETVNNYPSTKQLKEEAKLEKNNRDPKDPMKTDIWTVDPRTGKEVGVITNAQRRNLELYLQSQNKKPERSPGLYIQSST